VFTKLKIGLFGVGLDVYWNQFEGLKKRLISHLNQVHTLLSSDDIEIVNLGLIDTVGKAMDAGHRFRQADVDMILLYASTYALSATVLPVVQRAKVPVIILNLSPKAAVDYASFNALKDRHEMTGEWLTYCAACPVPEVANVFRRAGISYYQVTGILDPSDSCWQEIADWITAAKVAHILAHNRLGAMGTYYSGMLDIYTDLTRQIATFGGHIELLEVDELSALRREVSSSEINKRVIEFSHAFDVEPDCDTKELEDAARTSVALDRMIAKYELGALAYYYKGTGSAENKDTMRSIILGSTYLTAKGVPVAGEYEIKNAQAMKILDSFGAGGSFSEYYALDFNDDVVLMGHDGPGHYQIAEGKIKVKPLVAYHGKVGNGLSIEMSVKHGPVTFLSVVEDPDGKLFFLVAEGTSVLGPILEIGNTNSRYRFPINIRQFVEEWNRHGPAHHCAIGVGHLASKIEKLGKLIGIETIKVCSDKE